MRPKLNLAFADFWPSFKAEDNYFYHLLCERYDVVLSDRPDLLIYSGFGRKHRAYRCTRLLYTGENVRADYGIADYALTFDRTERVEHHRFPNFLFYAPERLVRPEVYDPAALLGEKTRFCNFLYSNPGCARRIRFLDRLSRYRFVDSGGGVLNNQGAKVTDKAAHLRAFKFTIAFENQARPGYVTEKIVDAMLADSLPIYWGAPDIGRDFNTRSFLHARDFANDDALIDEIIALDRDDQRYIERMSQPWLPDNAFPDAWRRETVAAFLDRVIASTAAPVATRPFRSVNYGAQTIRAAAQKVSRAVGRSRGAAAIRAFEQRADQHASPETGAVPPRNA